MTYKKEAAPTGQAVQGRRLTTNKVYHTAGRLSMAGGILMLIEQAPAHAYRLRAVCWERLEQVLRRHYEGGARMKTPQKRIVQRWADMPVIYRGIYDKAMTGQSRAAAIHAFCLECMGWQRQEVKLCTSYACPLFPYRPYKGQDDCAESPNDDGNCC
jgi:hypothetical protein